MAESTGQTRRNVDVPEGLWIRCVQCGAMLIRLDLVAPELMVVTALDAYIVGVARKQVPTSQDRLIVGPGIETAVDQGDRQIVAG